MRKTSLTLTVAGFALICTMTTAKAQSPGVEVNYDVLKNTAIHQHYAVQKEKEQTAQENMLSAPESMMDAQPDVSGTGAFLTGPEVSGEILDGAAPVLTDPMPHQEDAAADAEKLFEEMQGVQTAPEQEMAEELPLPAEAAPETVINWVEEEKAAETAAPSDAPVVEMMPADPRILKTEPDELPESLRREMMGIPSGDIEQHSAAPVEAPVVAAPVTAAPEIETKAEVMPEKIVPRPLQRPAAAKQQAIEKREAQEAVSAPEALPMPDKAPVEEVAAEKLPLPEASLMPEASVAPAVSMDVENAVSLAFDGSESRITPEMETVLKDITTRLAANNGLRVQLNAFASGEAGNQSSARRISLSRALSARDYLVEHGGITPTRMDVRALGDQTQKQPIDRIDFVFVE
jgi:outer membrane protein OmpA-like peptidoglycan-associated protein